MAQQTQTVIISGTCFGTGNTFSSEDNPYIAIIDNTYPSELDPTGVTSWDACSNYIAFVGIDGVTCDVSSWTNTSITFSGFTGLYGSNDWVINQGDALSVNVWNAQTNAGPGSCLVTAGDPLITYCSQSIPPPSPMTTTVTTLNSNAIDVGGSVTDSAVVAGNALAGAPTGTVDFYVCGPEILDSPCTSTDQPLGTPTLESTDANASSASSNPFNPASNGTYCIATVYVPSTGSLYLSSSDDNSGTADTNECFTVGSSTGMQEAVTVQGFAQNFEAQQGFEPSSLDARDDFVAGFIIGKVSGCDLFVGPSLTLGDGAGGGLDLGGSLDLLGPVPITEPGLDVFAGPVASLSIATTGCEALAGFTAQFGLSEGENFPPGQVLGIVIPLSNGPWCFYRDTTATAAWEQTCAYKSKSSTAAITPRLHDDSVSPNAIVGVISKINVNNDMMTLMLQCYGGKPKARCLGRLELLANVSVGGHAIELLVANQHFSVISRATEEHIRLTSKGDELLKDGALRGVHVRVRVTGSGPSVQGAKTLLLIS